MYTREAFESEWRHRHHPGMDVSGDVSFYHGVYKRLRDIASVSAKYVDDRSLVSMAMYVENTVAIGLDTFYERMYRCVGDVVRLWCDRLEVSQEGYSLAYELMSESVAEAPRSGLRAWMVESILSRDFRMLEEVALFLVTQDTVMSLAHPFFRSRERAFMRLAGNDREKAWGMIRADRAFNWRDKKGLTLLERLGELLADSVHADDDRFLTHKEEITKNISSLRPFRIEAYLPREANGNGTLTLEDKHGNVFRNVVFPKPLSSDCQRKCLICQLVTYLGVTYTCGSMIWKEPDTFHSWDGERFWHDTEEGEREEARHRTFTTPFGKEMSYYEDLYPEYTGGDDGEDAYYDDFGVYLDEPNALGVLDWLATR